ncbi:MAG: sigma-70 family RNA polymerase sigma factor [Planctomycetes bacterium]|nr:sigma-70 family RNA polymerase sigma factor [Planctomycetota bacterium]
MNPMDTTMAQGMGGFPTTASSEVAGLSHAVEPAWASRMESLSRRYWRPVYLHLRMRWGRSNDEAKDLAQEFFVRLLDRELLRAYRPERGRFRTFLRAVLDNFVREHARTEGRLKRGGGRTVVGLEAASPAAEEADVFTDAWRREVVMEALDRLERAAEKAGVPLVAALLRQYYLDPDGGTYQSLAQRFGMTIFDATNLLHRGRTWLRQIVVDVVGETVTDRERLQEEIGELFG